MLLNTLLLRSNSPRTCGRGTQLILHKIKPSLRWLIPGSTLMITGQNKFDAKQIKRITSGKSKIATLAELFVCPQVQTCFIIPNR